MSSKRKQKSVTLKEWIDELGIAEVAALLRADRTAVRNWRRGFVLPVSSAMGSIRKASKNRVDFNKTIDQHYAPENKKRWKRPISLKTIPQS